MKKNVLKVVGWICWGILIFAMGFFLGMAQISLWKGNLENYRIAIFILIQFPLAFIFYFLIYYPFWIKKLRKRNKERKKEKEVVALTISSLEEKLYSKVSSLSQVVEKLTTRSDKADEEINHLLRQINDLERRMSNLSTQMNREIKRY